MIVNALAVIGAIWLGTKANQFIRWYFRTNRDGLSGRFGKTWDD